MTELSLQSLLLVGQITFEVTGFTKFAKLLFSKAHTSMMCTIVSHDKCLMNNIILFLGLEKCRFYPLNFLQVSPPPAYHSTTSVLFANSSYFL
jgi:hypothetical protein